MSNIRYIGTQVLKYSRGIQAITLPDFHSLVGAAMRQGVLAKKRERRGGWALGQLLQGLQTLDSRGFLYINHNLQNRVFDVVMPFFTHLGSGGLIWLFLAFGLAVFGKGAGRKMAFLAIVALLVSWFLSEEVIKNLVARPRPFLSFSDARILADKPLSFSFPSGHTNISFASAVTLLRKNRRVGVPALILAAFIGFSRVYVGVHYPLDVLGGALLGSTIGWHIVSNERYIDKIIVRYKSLVAKYARKNRYKENG